MNKYNFQKLTPVKNVDMKIYEEALDFVFTEDDLKNIAITGAYSAGKSSIIETYKDSNPNKSFLNISLAHFESIESATLQHNEENQQKSDSSFKDTTLEGKILNQLIHQIDPKRIPQTHFKVKKHISRQKLFKGSLLTTIILFLAIYIWKFNNWRLFVTNSQDVWIKQYLTFTTLDTTFILGGIALSAALAFTIYQIIKMFSFNRVFFRKLKFQGNEIEIFEHTNESYFDKYLNEVLYLFENADAEAIIFEDMDRFESTRIFEKLREINALINRKSARTIRFLYLLKDDTFTSKDRTKFFDFIIPVVPIVDGSNSYDLFIEHFKKGRIIDQFDEYFLKGLSLYIDDMRLLKNIYNEYIIYHERIQSTELKSDRLLAIIAYKNIFPHDFSELQLGRGFVFNIFEKKADFIKEEKEELNKEITELKNFLDAAEKEYLEDIDELDAIFFVSQHHLRVNGRTVSDYKTQGHFLKALKENSGNVTAYYNNGGWYQYDFDTEYQKMLENKDYQNRKKIIDAKTVTVKEKIKEKILELQRNINVLENKKLCEIISKVNTDKIFSVCYINEIDEITDFNSIKSSPYFKLIKYLVRNGHVDESYSDYMTYFYEHSLSREDKIFLRSVADVDSKEYSYKLKNPSLVISRLRDIDLEHEETLNFDLLAYLLQSNHQKLPIFLKQIKERLKYDFVTDFWSTKEEANLLIKAINHSWSGFAKGLINLSDYPNKEKHKYIIKSFHFSSEEDLRNQNSENCITEYISYRKNFLDIDKPDIMKIINSFELLGVKFEQIEYETANKTLFLEVYKNSYYQINYYMLSLILNEIYKMEETRDFKHKNFTLITSRPQEPVVSYIKSNINVYMQKVLEFCNGEIADDEAAVIEILNNSLINDDYKLVYLDYLKSTIRELTSIHNSEFWRILTEKEIVIYSEYNILCYYFKLTQKMDRTLVSFINNNDIELSFSEEIYNRVGDGQVESLLEDIIQCNEMLDSKYDMFIKGFNRSDEAFIYEEISASKMRILITRGIIQMNDTNLRFIRGNYSENLVFFIISNIDTYTNEVISEDNFDFSELTNILEENIEDTYKLSLLEYCNQPISIIGKNQYSDSLKSYIIQNNFQTNDLPKLIVEYNRVNEGLKHDIFSVCIEHSDLILSEKCEIPFPLLILIFESTEEGRERKLELFASQFMKLRLVQVQQCLQQLELTSFSDLFQRKRPKIEITPINTQLLEAFKQRNWIIDFKIDENDSTMYRTAGRTKIPES
ncbi:hypothetical protein ACPV3A_32675 [Paenibacillus sp. Dod16]|uniref:YobI family P-loop NTPase n=1 Tax=Paenibacillus sp. Dod16 TaxID=3416392 RepID=UPI003CEBFE3B